MRLRKAVSETMFRGLHSEHGFEKPSHTDRSAAKGGVGLSILRSETERAPMVTYEILSLMLDFGIFLIVLIRLIIVIIDTRKKKK